MSDQAKKELSADLISAHYLSGSHWDREWYRPFEEFRLLLVEMMDEVMRLLEEDAAFQYFHLDGQTSMLEDYLELRPECRSRLAEHIRAGRILIGPWYTMPDLFCVGGEALIRNLLMGQTIAREWGVEPMKVGFVCDMFGLPSKMPQIFAGFGHRYCVLGRGTNEATTPMFFRWESSDGAGLFTFKLQDAQGYGALAWARMQVEGHGAGGVHPNEKADRKIPANEHGEEADPEAASKEAFASAVRHYVEHECGRTDGRALALMDWMDHCMPAPSVSRYKAWIEDACPQLRVTHSTLPAFFEEAEQSVRNPTIRRGELREPAKGHEGGYLYLIPNCVSARVRIKQRNARCQSLLEWWADPWVAFANADGAHIPTRALRKAWEGLLENHAHDSICGCSIDQVHRDMLGRFDRVRILGEQLRNRAVGWLTRSSRELGNAPHAFTLTLVNPLPRERSEVFDFTLDLPKDFPTAFQEGFRTQRVSTFRLQTVEGEDVPYQLLGVDPDVSERSRFARPGYLGDPACQRYRLAAYVTLPATGYLNLRVVPDPRPMRSTETLMQGPRHMANEHLSVALQSDGAFALTDLATGEVYPDLLRVEDRSELGDGWFHGHSLNDRCIQGNASIVASGVVTEGPAYATLYVTFALRVPRFYDWQHEKPAKETVELLITHEVTLRRGARVIEIKTEINNNAEDHRLQLLLPTGAADAKSYLAHLPFDFVERPIGRDPQTADWREMEVVEKPFLGIQAVGDDRRGLAFLCADGLHEGGVRDDRGRTLQVTLLRSFRRTVQTQGEEDGLEMGQTTLRYALMPWRKGLPKLTLLEEWERLQAGIMTRQSGTLASGFPPLAAEGPVTQSFFSISGKTTMSTLKGAADGSDLVVRLWNPTASAVTETVRFAQPVASASLVSLGEDPLPGAPPAVEGDTVFVGVPPYQLVTIRVSL